MKTDYIPTSIVLFDQDQRTQLLPLSFTKPVAEFRFGILTMRQKWERMLPGDYSYLTAEYLSNKYPLATASEYLFIAANICPSMMLCAEIVHLLPGEVLMQNDRVIAYRGGLDAFKEQTYANRVEYADALLCFDQLYDLFGRNGQALEEDYRLLTEGRESAPMPDSVRVLGKKVDADGMPRIFLEEGVAIEEAILNVKSGPIYLGKGVEVQEGTVIRGPFAACEHAVLNINTKVYGPTTLGPYVKAGGELNNVLFFGYTNKAHEGFLGNAVIGEWCNIGAGTNASNLRNDYADVKLWNYAKGRFLKTGLQFCGVIMGDHSRTGINSMLNTATVIGVGVNVYGSGYPRNFVPSFSEGGASGFGDVALAKFFRSADLMMERRGMRMSEEDRLIFEHIYMEADEFK